MHDGAFHLIKEAFKPVEILELVRDIFIPQVAAKQVEISYEFVSLSEMRQNLNLSNDHPLLIR